MKWNSGSKDGLIEYRAGRVCPGLKFGRELRAVARVYSQAPRLQLDFCGDNIDRSVSDGDELAYSAGDSETGEDNEESPT